MIRISIFKCIQYQQTGIYLQILNPGFSQRHAVYNHALRVEKFQLVVKIIFFGLFVC